SQISLRGS
nr:RecName: Full=Pregnancy-associated glycoprotein 50F; AltName: Full=EbPAG-F 50 kDa [Bison bonasus]